jgi:hypothetical protein
MSDNVVDIAERAEKAEAPPAPQPAEGASKPPTTEPAKHGRFRRAWTYAALLLVVGLVGHVSDTIWSVVTDPFKRSAPPPISSQLNEVVSKAARDGFRLVGPPHKIRFRAAGPASWMLLFRPLDITSKSSDELRIYDVEAKKLRLGFDFRPEILVRQANASAGVAPTAPLQLPRAFSISIRQVRDLDGAPGNEVVVDLAEFSVTPLWPRPALIFWNAATQKFEIEPFLSPHSTHLASMNGVITRQYLSRSDSYTRALIAEVYTRPVKIADATGHTPPVATYAVEAYILRREKLKDPRGQTSGGLALTAGYVVKSSGFGTPDLLQAITWHIDLRREPLTAKGDGKPAVILRVGADFSRLTTVLERAT